MRQFGKQLKKIMQQFSCQSETRLLSLDIHFDPVFVKVFVFPAVHNTNGSKWVFLWFYIFIKVRKYVVVGILMCGNAKKRAPDGSTLPSFALLCAWYRVCALYRVCMISHSTLRVFYIVACYRWKHFPFHALLCIILQCNLMFDQSMFSYITSL